MSAKQSSELSWCLPLFWNGRPRRASAGMLRRHMLQTNDALFKSRLAPGARPPGRAGLLQSLQTPTASGSTGRLSDRRQEAHAAQRCRLEWRRVSMRHAQDTAATPNCCSMPSSSELPQRSTILPSLNFAICAPRIFIFRPVGATPLKEPFCVPLNV